MDLLQQEGKKSLGTEQSAIAQAAHGNRRGETPPGDVCAAWKQRTDKDESQNAGKNDDGVHRAGKLPRRSPGGDLKPCNGYACEYGRDYDLRPADERPGVCFGQTPENDE